MEPPDLPPRLIELGLPVDGAVPLRVLIVEKLPEDAEQMIQEIQKHGYVLHWRRVSTVAEFQAALRSELWNVVLSEYALPNIDGLGALRMMQKSGLDLPFIMVSGSPSEEQAVAAIKAGAHDYLVKRRLGRLGEVVARELREDGERRSRRREASSVRTGEEEVRRLLALAEHSRIELLGVVEQQRETQERLKLRTSALDAAANAVVITDASGMIEWINPAFTELTGYAGADCLGRNLRHLLRPGGSEDSFYDKLWETILAGHVWRGVVVSRKRDGQLYDEEQTITPVSDEAGMVSHFICIKQDITDRRKAEEQLRKQAALLDAATDAIYVCDSELRVSYWNKGAERLYGWKSAEALGKGINDLLWQDPVAFAKAHSALLERREWSGELKVRCKTGETLSVFASWTRLGMDPVQNNELLAIETDFTEMNRLEAQFLQAQRLEGIGALASGIAHDLNNILAPVLMTAPLLRGRVADPEDVAMLETIESCAKRGANILRQLLTFAKGTPGARIPIPLRNLLREVELIIRETFPREIQILMEMPSGIWPVVGDAVQLHQALMNLCLNARDAMPDGGTLTLEVRNVTVDAAFAAMTHEANPGPHACLSVKDTGTGIAPENLSRIFEPFFTTKEIGKGSGLGLPSVLGIVRGHQGFVRVSTALGRGTTFELYFPALPEGKPASPSGRDVPAARGAGECVLVVDDEPAVIDGLRRVLMGHGYRVLSASHGAEGLALFAQHRDEIRVILTDMMMPVMNGPALVNAVYSIDRSVPIIGMTGLPDEQHVKGLENLSLAAMMAKPFSGDKVLRLLDLILRNSRA